MEIVSISGVVIMDSAIDDDDDIQVDFKKKGDGKA